MEEALLYIENRIDALRQTVSWGDSYISGVEQRMESTLDYRRRTIQNIADPQVRENSRLRLEENWNQYGIDLLHAKIMHQATEPVIQDILTDVEEIEEDDDATLADITPLATRINNAFGTLAGVIETLQAWQTSSCLVFVIE